MMKGNRNRKEKQLVRISFSLNGQKVEAEIKSSTILLDLIRDVFSLKGTKGACREGECGSCTVLLNDVPVNSCLFPAINANGKNITTIEGLTKSDGSLDEVQEAIVQNGASQCGFCTSGVALAIKGLKYHYKKLNNSKKINAVLTPNRKDIKKWLEGNLCRCTGYVKIIDAAEKALINE